MDNRNIFVENLRYYMDKKGVTRRDISEALGFSYYTVTSWENGTKYPRMDKVERLANYFGIKKSDLIEERVLPAAAIPANIFAVPASVSYPVLGDIACGRPILAQENIEEYVNVPADIGADFCLRCRGDSMTEARIYDGDIVFIRQQDAVENGEIAAVLIEDEATLKRVYKAEDSLTLLPANPKYPPMVFAGEQLKAVHVIGKAISFMSNVR